jgi:hypothetical protein
MEKKEGTHYVHALAVAHLLITPVSQQLTSNLSSTQPLGTNSSPKLTPHDTMSMRLAHGAKN